MKKLFAATLLLALMSLPIPTMGEVHIGFSISLPPPIIFHSPPELVVVPETYVYVVPDVQTEIFFYNGWWWRPWEGRWYRSRRYNSGWEHYRHTPSFYREIPRSWRSGYRTHNWRGHEWRHQPIPHQDVQRNWKQWEKSRHWEREHHWGVNNLPPAVRPKQTKQDHNRRNYQQEVHQQHYQPQLNKRDYNRPPSQEWQQQKQQYKSHDIKQRRSKENRDVQVQSHERGKPHNYDRRTRKQIEAEERAAQSRLDRR